MVNGGWGEENFPKHLWAKEEMKTTVIGHLET